MDLNGVFAPHPPLPTQSLCPDETETLLTSKGLALRHSLTRPQFRPSLRFSSSRAQILNSRENELDNARERDAADFQRRQQETPEVLAALELVIEKLGTIAPNTNDDNLVLAELSKIGNSNPILALVQVASTFSPEALQSVVNKMQELHNSIEASIEDDAREEQEAINEYNQLKAEISTTR